MAVQALAVQNFRPLQQYLKVLVGSVLTHPPERGGLSKGGESCQGHPQGLCQPCSCLLAHRLEAPLEALQQCPGSNRK
jgi:hypothetical protein